MAKYGDNFSRPDNDALGTPWVESESAAGALQILGDRLSAQGIIGGGWAYYDAAYGNDQDSSLQVTDASPYRARLVVRGSGTYTSFTGYVLTIPSVPNSLTIQRWEGVNLETGAGTITNVATVAISAKADSRYSLVVIGTLLRVFRNGILMLEGTDAVITSGKAGMLVMTAQPEGKSDDWQGGDVFEITWTINDIAPIPLAQTFAAAPAESDVVPFDVAPFELLHDFAAPPAESVQPHDIAAPFELIMAFGGGPADQNITADQSITSQEAFGSARVDHDVAPSGVPTAEAFGTLRVDHDVAPSGIPTAEAFGTARIDHDIQPAGISTAEAFGTPDLTAQVVESGGIPTAEAFGSARVDHDVAPTGVPSAEAFGTPSITLDISPAGIPSAEAFGNTRLDHDVQPSGVPSGEVFGQATIAHEQQIVASGIPSAEAFGALSVSVGGELFVPDRPLLELGIIDIDRLPDREGLEADAPGEITMGARSPVNTDTLEVSVLPTRKRLKLGVRLL